MGAVDMVLLLFFCVNAQYVILGFIIKLFSSENIMDNVFHFYFVKILIFTYLRIIQTILFLKWI